MTQRTKVFIGNLKKDVQRWRIAELLESLRCTGLRDLHIKNHGAHAYAMSFAEFETKEQAYMGMGTKSGK